MCTYGIGLPFDHPIWQNLPPCHCGLSVPQQTYLTLPPRWDNPPRLPWLINADETNEPDPTVLLEHP